MDISKNHGASRHPNRPAWRHNLLAGVLQPSRRTSSMTTITTTTTNTPTAAVTATIIIGRARAEERHRPALHSLMMSSASAEPECSHVNLSLNATPFPTSSALSGWRILIDDLLFSALLDVMPLTQSRFFIGDKNKAHSVCATSQGAIGRHNLRDMGLFLAPSTFRKQSF